MISAELSKRSCRAKENSINLRPASLTSILAKSLNRLSGNMFMSAWLDRVQLRGASMGLSEVVLDYLLIITI